jgi:MFS family permease
MNIASEESVKQDNAQPRFHYGWLVVAAAFAITFVGFGGAYSFGTFIPALERDFGASRGSISLVFALAGFLYFAFGIVSGPLADRWGPRPLALTGMLFVGLGLAAAGCAQTLMQVYVAYGLGVGLGIGFAYVPVLGAVQRWFVKRRALASGLAVSGIGVGTLAMPPLVAVCIEALGWRNAYFMLSVLAAIVGGGMALLIEDDPRRRGLAPDGTFEQPTASPEPIAGTPLREAIRSTPFIALYAAAMICSFGVFVPFVHLVPYAIDHGVAPAAAALLLSAIGVGSTGGRFLLGGLADRIGRTRTLCTMIVGMAVTLALWAGCTSLWTLAAFATVYGVFYGAWVAVTPSVVADHFGARYIGSIIGVLFTSVAFGTLIGPTVAGYIYDASGSYTLPILASAGANAVAAVIVAAMAASHPRRRNG